MKANEILFAALIIGGAIIATIFIVILSYEINREKEK